MSESAVRNCQSTDKGDRCWQSEGHLSDHEVPLERDDPMQPEFRTWPRTYHERLLAEYTEIVKALGEGEASVNIDPEDQEAVAELFTSAAVQLSLQMNREDQQRLTDQVQALRSGK